MDAALELLTDLTVSLAARDAPAAVHDKMTEIVVDSVACGIGGRDCPAVRSVRGVPVTTASEGQAVLLGTNRQVPPDLAAFWNTAMIRYLDHNDLTSSGHPSDIVGALLAVGSAVGASGPQVITAGIAAYEVFGRVAERILAERKTLDQGYAIAIATAAATAVLLQSTAEQTRHAIAMAATSSVPLRATRSGQLSEYKGVATSMSTRDGVFVAYLAHHGLTGPSAPFEGRHGIVELLEGEPGSLHLEGPPGRWITLENCLKYFPTAYNMQPSVWAALELRQHVSAEHLGQVTLHAAPFSWHESGSEPEKWDPQTRETADHSLPYVFAHALRHGVFDSTAYEPSAFRDPQTLELMQRVTVTPDWSRGGLAGTVIGVQATATDLKGEEFTIEINEPRGHYKNPLTTEEISDKAQKLMEPVFGDGTEAVISDLWQLAEYDDIRRLLQVVCFDPS